MIAGDAPPPLNAAVIKDAFPGAFDKGVAYFRQRRVLRIEHDVISASGKVQGSRSAPYRVTVGWTFSRKRWRLESQCACPMVFNCKHVVALALVWMATQQPADAGAGPPSPPAPKPAAPAPAVPPAGAPPVAAVPPPPTAKRPQRLDPWAELLHAAARDADRGSSVSADGADVRRAEAELLFLFALDHDRRDLLVRPVACRTLKSGRFGAPRALPMHDDEPLGAMRKLPVELAAWVLAVDDDEVSYLDECAWCVVRPRFEAVLDRVIASGRARWKDANGRVLAAGAPRALVLAWQVDDHGVQRVTASAGADAAVVGDTWSWYVAPGDGMIGRTTSALPTDARARLARLPPLWPEHHASARTALERLFPQLDLPAFAPVRLVQAPAARLRAHLLLGGQRSGSAEPAGFPFGFQAQLHFHYDRRVIAADDPGLELRVRDGDAVRVVPRDAAFEAEVARFLHAEGFRTAQAYSGGFNASALRWHRAAALRSADAARAWVEGFMARAAALRIDVEGAAGFPMPASADVGVPEIALEDAGNGWFTAQLGLDVDGERVDLLPVLVGLGTDADRVTVEGMHLHLPSGRMVRLSAERLRPMLDLLHDLERRPEGLGVRAERLAGYQPPADWRFRADARLNAFLEQLRGFAGLAPLDPPPGFGATLRPYQRIGVAWLDFLRRFGFGGVLADDMGLGKTVQCLAFLARERAHQRLRQPVLVVCPTSVAPNWIAEATRLVPELTVQMLARGDRAALLAELRRFDLVVTSYALMLRDIEVLREIDWSLAVFDEAQWLKNVASKGYRAAASLRADLRLCMTGTPVENHLGELKAQMDLAMPGLLGDDRQFTTRFRTPIERVHDGAAETALRARIRPFLLRRTKAVVATDLPPRTTIVQSVQFEAAQQDLYETLRAQMERRVRDALAKRGVAQSTITVLDALLKLRQVCCDPSLVDLPAARKVTASAKREALGALLPTLIEDGRSVLVFSQFTSMLDLLAQDLEAAGISFARLDGSTRHRAAPVMRFQRGEVPVFLISLKAGGVGLNLTRADTVILYDPWWNPAVEAQAIDRAHRIGQDKPVFVYELQCVGTVEEKMAHLKQRKRAIADAVLAGGESAIAKLDAGALLALFEPVAAPVPRGGPERLAGADLPVKQRGRPPRETP